MEQANVQTEYYDALLREYCLTRDIDLRNELLVHYSYIAQIAAKKFAGRGVEYEDLYQVASLALLKALERYDDARGVKFGSFATPSVLGEIKNYFRDRSKVIRLPRRAGEAMKKLTETQEELTLELGRPPRPEEIAKRMEIPLEQVYQLVEMKANAHVLSLDEALPGSHGEEGQSLGEILGHEPEEYSRIETTDLINRALSMVTPEERDILIQRFVHNKSQRAIAEQMDVSQMYISRLERKVLLKLREALS